MRKGKTGPVPIRNKKPAKKARLDADVDVAGNPQPAEGGHADNAVAENAASSANAELLTGTTTTTKRAAAAAAAATAGATGAAAAAAVAAANQSGAGPAKNDKNNNNDGDVDVDDDDDDGDDDDGLSGLAALAGYGSSSDSEGEAAASSQPAEASSKPMSEEQITALVEDFHAADDSNRPAIEAKLQATGITVGVPGAAYLWNAVDGRHGPTVAPPPPQVDAAGAIKAAAQAEADKLREQRNRKGSVCARQRILL